MNGPLRLNLGCGRNRVDGMLGVDRVPLPEVDVVHDLDTGPWPWLDGSVHQILAEHVFEHVADPILFMTECHRILAPDGELMIISPHWRHRDAYTDPTHRRYCTEHTFDYWIQGTTLNGSFGAAYGDAIFTAIRVRRENSVVIAHLTKKGVWA